MSMMVRFDCEDMQCGAFEDVDVYENDLAAGAALRGYVPDDWRIVRSGANGIALAVCPRHASPAIAAVDADGGTR